MTVTHPASVAFVLVSYRPDEPAGMERAVAAMSAGLRELGHRAVVLTAAAQPPHHSIVRLRELPVAFPCDDHVLRSVIRERRAAVAAEIDDVLGRLRADAVVYADALWGLGSLAADVRYRARPVLAVHVVGHRRDLVPALAAAHRVVAPSAAVLAEAGSRGYDTARWRVVPNPLLIAPEDVRRPDMAQREQLRRAGPVRIAARLGAEKGVTRLLGAAPRWDRQIQVVLAEAAFEERPGSQRSVLAECESLASGAEIRPRLAWREVPAFFAGAAVTIVPSVRETFGNVALESLSAGTPVVAHATGNLPALLDGSAGSLVPVDEGPDGLWRAARTLLADPVRYREACEAAYCRSRNYRPADIADAFLKAAW